MRILLAAALTLFAATTSGCGGGGSGGSAGGSGPGAESLTLSGTIKADSGGAKGSGTCVWTPAIFGLEYRSSALPTNITVAFKGLVSIGGVGDIDAAAPPAADGTTPLVLRAGGRVIKAKQGTIHVTDAALSDRTWKGSFDADFEDGTHLSGGWTCTAPL